MPRLCPVYLRLSRTYAELVIARVPSIPAKLRGVDAAWRAITLHCFKHGCVKISGAQI
jgi:hypothetical protein